jgi:hypothetical protein
MRTMAVFLWVLVLPITSSAQSDTRPEILVLGTFHMGNPGRDIHSTQVDDVLAPKRQEEIAQLIGVLKRFRPTKIAVEVNVGSKRAAQQYADYLAGKYTLSRNEIDQIGYRLAKELGHQTVYAVDEDGDFPFYRVRNWAIANGKKETFEAAQSSVGARVKVQDEFLAKHTVLETLELLNSDSAAATAVSEYYSGYVPFGEPYEYAGPDLVAAWFQRNIRIYRNILAIITSPNDRVLVIYGAGHLGWLRQDVANDATVRLRKLHDLAGQE